MTIIAIGGEKGGVGKTCLSVNIASVLAGQGRKVALVDTDARPSALAWLGERALALPRIHGAFDPHRVRPQRATGFDDLIIDAGAGDTEVFRDAMQVADLLLSPFRPAQFDVWKAKFVAERIGIARERNKRLRAFAVVNAAPTGHHRRDAAVEARRALLTFRGAWRVADTIVWDRAAWVETQKTGLGVAEHGARGRRARAELYALMGEMGLAA